MPRSTPRTQALAGANPRLLVLRPAPQTQAFARLDKAEMGVWEALALLNELREYEAPLLAEPGEAQVGAAGFVLRARVLLADGTTGPNWLQRAAAVHLADCCKVHRPIRRTSGVRPHTVCCKRPLQDIASLPLLEHALQTAELCRLAHPQLEWLPLVGLLHGLGKLLAHPRYPHGLPIKPARRRLFGSSAPACMPPASGAPSPHSKHRRISCKPALLCPTRG